MNRKLIYGLTVATLVLGIILGYLLIHRPPGAQVEFCPSTALIYVYLDDQQKSVADEITSNFKVILQQHGLNIINVPVCTIPASSLSRKLRVYPALLYRGNISALSMFTVGEVDGYKVLNPGISAYMASQIGIKPAFTYTAELYVVKGGAPFSEIKADESSIKYLADLLSLNLVANITMVQQASIDSLSINHTFTRLPTIIFKSSYNLSEGYTDVVTSLGGNFYAFREDITERILRYLETLGWFQAYETRIPPQPELLRKGVVLGESDNVMYILEDYHCPWCARLINAAGDMLYSYAKTGKLQIVFVDLIVHPEVLSMHALTKCVYNYTKEGDVYFNVSRELYSMLIAGTTTTLSDANKTLMKYVPKSIIDACTLELNKYQADAQAFSYNLTQQGFTGTPTLIFWNTKTQKCLIVEGCLDVQTCITEQQISQIISWLQG